MSMSNYPCFKRFLSLKLVSIIVMPSIDLSYDKIQLLSGHLSIQIHKIVTSMNYNLPVSIP